MPPTRPPNIIGVREAMTILNRDKMTVLRWARQGDLTIVYQLPGRNGAILLDRAEVLKLAARLAREAGEAS